MNYLAAQINNPALGETLQNKTGISFFQAAIPSFVGTLLAIGALVFFFVLLVGAIGWITSGGDKAKVEVARGRITSAIIGIVLLFATFALVGVIENFFSINILELDFEALKIRP